MASASLIFWSLTCTCTEKADRDGKVVTAGGRVLCVTALGESVKLAAERAYEIAAGIHFDGMQLRRDIGHRAIHRH